MKLSPAQHTALLRLTPVPTNAYKLKTSLSTLQSLVNRGLAKSVPRTSSVGAMFSPRTHFQFVITQAGQEWLRRGV